MAPLKKDDRAGWLIVLAGLGLALAIQTGSPSASPPLYDGVAVVEPYLWLDPPPEHPGGAKSVDAVIEVEDGKSGDLVLATPELTPQAQIFGVAGALTILPTTTSIRASIGPVNSPDAPPGTYVDGNTYRVSVTDQSGAALSAPASSLVTLVMRAADPALLEASIGRFDGTTWTLLDTQPSGFAGFLAIVTDFGDFAILANGESPYPTGGDVPSPRSGQGAWAFHDSDLVLLAAAAIVVLLILAIVLSRRRRRRRSKVRHGWG